MKTALFLLLTMTIIGCDGGMTLKTHGGFGNPSTYELTDGTNSITYYNGDCCCIAKYVLLEVKARVERNELRWEALITDREFRGRYLRNLCKEMVDSNANLNKEYRQKFFPDSR